MTTEIHNKEMPNKEMPNKETPNKEIPNKETPNKEIPATENVKNSKTSNEATVRIFSRDKYKVLSKDLKPSEDLTILNNLATLITLKAVILICRSTNKVSSITIKLIKTMHKSNLFQLTCQ